MPTPNRIESYKWGRFSPKSLHSIRESNRRINLWHGAVRSSKTVSSQVRWLKYIAQSPPGGHLLMVGVTIGTLKDNILDPISEMVGAENYHLVSGSREVWICGRRCLIRGANDEASEKKIRGLTLSGVYGDEITLWPQNFFKRCLDRLSVRGAKLFGTTNPDSPYHWLKTDYLDREHELNMAAFHFELDDNPNLPDEYVADLKKEFTGLWYKRFILGLWVVAEGAIYDMFEEEKHVVYDWKHIPGWSHSHRPPFERVIDGVDYGTTNPTSFLRVGLWAGVWYAFADHRHEGGEAKGGQKTDEQHSKAYQQFTAAGGITVPQARREPKWFKKFQQAGGIIPESVEIDPSAASLKTQFKNDGITNIHNADHDVLDGIRVVATGLSSGKFKIHHSCTELIKEFSTYTWDPKAQEDRGEDKPLKVRDHSLDAARYALMRAIGKRTKRNRPKPTGA